MSATLLFNLMLLAVVGGLLVWFPDRLTLVPLILSKVTPPIESNAPARPSRRSRRDPAGDRRQTKKAPKGKKRAKKKPARSPR